MQLMTCFHFLKITAVNVITVGRQLALILVEMMNQGIVDAQDIHLIGYSLGAQVAHQASKWFRHLTKNDTQPEGLRPGRITGLDPAAPLFQGYPGTHLVKEDADFVDVIHTSAIQLDGGVLDIARGRLGMSELVGTIDFFPNGGTTSQPGCTIVQVACSHQKSLVYFTNSLVDRKSRPRGKDAWVYPSKPCDSSGNQIKGGISSSMGMQAVNFNGEGRHCLLTRRKWFG